MKQIFYDTLKVLTKPEKKHFVFFALANTFISILDIFSLAGIVLFAGNMAGSKKIISLPLWLTNNNSIALIGCICFVFIIKNFAAIAINKNQFHFAYNVAARISSGKMKQYLNGSYKNYAEEDSSVFIRQIAHQPIQFTQYVLTGWLFLFTEVALIIFTTIALLAYNPIVFGLMIVVLAPPLLLMKQGLKKQMYTIRDSINKADEKNLQHLNESLKSYVEANIFGSKDFFVSRYSEAQKGLNSNLARLQAIQYRPSRMVEIFAIAGLLILVLVNNLFFDSASLLINIGAFVAAAYKFIPGAYKIINLSSQITAFRESITTNEAEAKEIGAHSTELNSVEFKNVSFSYTNKTVVSNLSFKIQKGEIIGLQGRSGQGKTTILNLLTGFLENKEGDIYLNGSKLSADKRKLYWRRISYVKQDPFLIHDSLPANISLHTQPNEVQLKKVLHTTGLMQSLTGMATGTHYFVTENGKNISGGQKQRIAIARALYKDADLIILDEPFNELDKASETEIMNTLKQLAVTGKMILLISHDETTLEHCNKVVCLDES